MIRSRNWVGGCFFFPGSDGRCRRFKRAGDQQTVTYLQIIWHREEAFVSVCPHPHSFHDVRCLLEGKTFSTQEMSRISRDCLSLSPSVWTGRRRSGNGRWRGSWGEKKRKEKEEEEEQQGFCVCKSHLKHTEKICFNLKVTDRMDEQENHVNVLKVSKTETPNWARDGWNIYSNWVQLWWKETYRDSVWKLMWLVTCKVLFINLLWLTAELL